MQAAIAVGLLALVAILTLAAGAFAVARWGLPLFRVALETYWSKKVGGFEQRVASLEADVTDLPRTWGEFAADAKKRQERARWHVRRVKRELEDRGLADAEIDDLDTTLRVIDGEGGGASGVHEVSSDVGQAPEPALDPVTIALRHKWHG